MAQKQEASNHKNQQRSSAESSAAQATASVQMQSLAPPPLQLKASNEIAEQESRDVLPSNYLTTSAAAPNGSPSDTSNNNGTNHSVSQQKQDPGPFQMPIQRKENTEPTTEIAPFQLKKSSRNKGMPEDVRGKMENAFQADFSNVNIHQDSQSATDVGALAYTQGNDVHFAPGQFKPDTSSGQELIGHELTHVVQQRAGRVQPTTQAAGMPVNDNTSLEQEADLMGRKAASGQVTGMSSANGLQSSMVAQRQTGGAAADKDWRTLQAEAIAINSSFNADYIRNELYQAMKGGFTGIGTDEDRVYRALAGLSDIEVLAVKKCYQETHGSSLESDIRGEFSGSEEERALALLQGNPTQADVATLHDAMAGLGTDEELIRETLRGKTAQERQDIITEYQNRYDVDLSDELESELGGNDLAQTNALLVGDTATADAIALDEAMHGGFLGLGLGTDEDAIEGTYEQIRTDVTNEFDRKISQIQQQAAAEGWTSGQLRTVLEREGCTSAALEAEILRRNQSVESSYNDIYGEQTPAGQSALRTAFESEMQGAELDVANAVADNDQTSADAAHLAVEFNSIFYADDDNINGILEGQYQRALTELRNDEWPMIQMELNRRAQAENWTPYQVAEERRKMEAQLEQQARAQATTYMSDLETNYDDRYQDVHFSNSGTVSRGLHSDLELFTQGSGEDQAMALLSQGGYLDPVQQIEFATRGAGTAEEALRAVFQGKTQEEIAEIRANWDALHPNESIEERIASELGGRDEFDTSMDMRGLAQNIDEDMTNMRDRTDWELDNATGGRMLGHAIGGPLAGEAIYDNFLGGNQEDILRERMAFMESQYAIINDVGNATPEEIALAEQLFQQGRQSIDVSIEGYREQADAVANGAAMAAAIAAGIAVSVLTGGAGAPGVAAALSAVSGMTVSATAAGAGMAALAAVASQVVTKSILLGEAYSNEDLLLDVGVGTVDVIAAMATVGIGNAALRGINIDALLSSKNVSTRLFANFAVEGAEGVISAVPSAITGNVFNDQVWSSANPLMGILQGTVAEIGMSGVMSGGMGSFGGFSDPNIGKHVDADATVNTVNPDAPHIVDTQGNPIDGSHLDDMPSLLGPDGNPVDGSHLHDTPSLLGPDGNPVDGSHLHDTPSLLGPDGNPVDGSHAHNTPGLLDADGNPLHGSNAEHHGLVDANGNPLSTAPETAPMDTVDANKMVSMPSNVNGYVDPNLSGRTVRVHYDLDANGLVQRVFLRMGPGATALDISLHANTVKLMQRYSGFSGRVRQILDRVRQYVGLKGGLPVGSKAWEAHLEIEKLPRIIQARMKELQNTNVDADAKTIIEADIRNLEDQLSVHQRTLDEMIITQGRGFVAADDEIDWDDFDESVLYRIVKTDKKGRTYGGGRRGSPHEPTLEDFNPKLETVTAEDLVNFIPKHGINDMQLTQIAELSNEDLIKFRGDDPISANGLDVTGGHHRMHEILRRVKAGTISPDTPIKIMFHD